MFIHTLLYFCELLISVQVEKLSNEVETQKNEKEALKAKAKEAEKKFNELSSIIENVCIHVFSYTSWRYEFLLFISIWIFTHNGSYI